MVVDGDGKVLWQTSGRFTAAGFNTLKEQVEALRKSVGPSSK
jgi:hypothetical protein